MRIALVLFAAVLSAGVASAQSKPQPASKPTLEQDLAAITEFNRKYLKAINDGDIATLSSLTDEDHIMITPGRPPLIGKAANDAANDELRRSVRTARRIDGQTASQCRRKCARTVGRHRGEVR